jgi:hypothetical protein
MQADFPSGVKHRKQKTEGQPMSLINVAFDGKKIFEWQGNADTLAQINQETTRMAKLAHTSPQALWQSTLVGIKQNGGRYFTANPKAEMLVVTWGLMALPTHRPDHPGVFGDYLDDPWNFDFNIKIDPEDEKRFTVEVTGGFLPDAHEAKAAIETFREVLNPEQEPRAGTHQSDLKIADLDSVRAIQLRWRLRDIRSNRTKMFPVSPDDLRTLTEMGLVEMRDDVLVLTNEGHRAIDNQLAERAHKPTR